MDTTSIHEYSAERNPPTEPSATAKSSRRHRMSRRREEQEREMLERRALGDRLAAAIADGACPAFR